MLVKDTGRQAKEHSPQNKEGYIFIIKKNWKGEETTFFLILGWTSRLTSLIPPLGLHGRVMTDTRTVMVLFKSYVH